MKIRRWIFAIISAAAFYALTFSPASATPELAEWIFNVDGVISDSLDGDSMPTEGALDASGLGTLTWTTDIVGDHTFIAFFDHEIDEQENSYSNEYGYTSGTPAAGQSWEIDEPGYVSGDIYDNVVAGALDNGIGIGGSGTTFPDDVSMAMGWDFTVAVGQTATIALILGESVPSEAFYLTQTDPDSQETIYFSSTLEFSSEGAEPVPEPATMLLLGTGLAGLAALRKKRRRTVA